MNNKFLALLLFFLVFHQISFAANAEGADTAPPLNDSRLAATVLWSLPFVSTASFRNAYGRTARANFNDIIYKIDSLPPALQWRTSNRPVINAAGFMNLDKFGPTVLEIPPVENKLSLIGSLLDSWQVNLINIDSAANQPEAATQYLIVPSDNADLAKDSFKTVRASTHNVWFDLRIVPTSTGDDAVNNAVAFLRKIKIYPLKTLTAVKYDIADIGETNPNDRETRYINITNFPFDARPKFDISYFRILSQFLTEEQLPEQYTEELSVLANLGIERGKPFEPNQATQHQLEHVLADIARMINRP